MAREARQLSLQLVQPNVSRQQRRKAAGRASQLPRLSISPREAAQMLGVSRDFFDEHVKPELRIIRRGSKTILDPGRRARALGRRKRCALGELRRRNVELAADGAHESGPDLAVS